MKTLLQISYAKPVSRVGSALFDVIFILAVIFVLDGLAIFDGQQIASAAFLSLASIGVCLYLILSWYFLQATPGMLLAGTRLVTEAGFERVGLARCATRLPALLLAAIPLGLGLILSVYDRRRQGLHDKIAGTLVIDDDESTKPLSSLLRELT